MTNKFYDAAKWSVLVGAPALATLVGAIGVIWGFDPEKLVLTITAVTTFVGAVVGVSGHTYNKKVANHEEL